MYVLSTFEQTEYLELAITALQQEGIPMAHILAVPLDLNQKRQGLGDSIHKSDGKSIVDFAFLIATFFGALGSIIGFELPGGPIVWGLGGFLFGSILGFIINVIITKKTKKTQNQSVNKFGEVILTVLCENAESKLVEKILWDHFAIGVAKLNFSNMGKQ